MHPLPDPTPFLDAVLRQLPDLDHLAVDHLCYRTASAADYRRLRDELALTHHLLAESEIGGRPIATFRLLSPLRHGHRSIPLLELPAPKPGRPYPAGYDHLEMVTDRPLRDFRDYLLARGVVAHRLDDRGLDRARNADLRLYLDGGLSVKFHELPLDEVIRREAED